MSFAPLVVGFGTSLVMFGQRILDKKAELAIDLQTTCELHRIQGLPQFGGHWPVSLT